jgi:hypothetical protein
MSRKDSMAKLPGLHERGGVFQLRVVIPLDLRPAYDGRTKVVQSLKTKDRREASIEGAKLRADLLQEFKDKRRALNPVPAAFLSPDLGRILGERMRSAILKGNLELRAHCAAVLSDISSEVSTTLWRGPVRARCMDCAFSVRSCSTVLVPLAIAISS